MTALLLGLAAILAAAVATLAVLLHRTRRDLTEARMCARLADSHAVSEASRAHDLDAALADLHARNARLTAERDEAVRTGQKAALAGMTVLAKERAEFLASLQAWQQLFLASMLLPPPQRALPAAPSMPEVLPSGEHAYVAGEPAVLLQLDGDDPADPLAGPLPAGANGTGGAR